MSTNKHTPGPWRIEMKDNYMKLYMPASGLEGDVARGYVGEASARLIAAAPDLLAALESAREFIVDGLAMGFVGMPGDEDVLEVIEKAISRAKGTNHSEVPNSSK